MRKPGAILFDLDDTLLCFQGVAEQAWETSCDVFVKAHALPYTRGALLTALRKTRQWYWGDPARHKAGREDMQNARREIVRRSLRELGTGDDALANELADRYSALQHSLIHLFPDTTGTLEALRRDGCRLGLITNGSSAGQREKINRFSLAPYFEIILIDQEVGFSKPDARMYRHARDLLGLRYSDLWMVGDNLVWDVEGPMALGMTAVWYDAKRTGLPADTAVRPDAVIRGLSELRALLP